MFAKMIHSWLPSRLSKPQAAEPWPLSDQLIKLSKRDYLCIRHATEGVLCLGATGAGKTSGSGKALNQAYLKAGFGGLVLCAKADEAAIGNKTLGRLVDRMTSSFFVRKGLTDSIS